jgi:hypothetical protein
MSRRIISDAEAEPLRQAGRNGRWWRHDGRRGVMGHCNRQPNHGDEAGHRAQSQGCTPGAVTIRGSRIHVLDDSPHSTVPVSDSVACVPNICSLH